MTDDLLPLPKKCFLGNDVPYGYDEADMRAYAAAAVAQERERCAQVVSDFPHWLGAQGKAELAAAIRATLPRTDQEQA